MRKINVTNNNGSCQLKWTVNGKRYSLNIGGRYEDPLAQAKAVALASQIRLDVLAQCFDSSLARYRPQARPKPEAKDLLGLWDLWVSSLDLPEAVLAGHYSHVRKMLVRSMPRLYDLDWLIKANLADRTKQGRVRMLRSCFRWAVDEGMVTANPWLKVKVRVSHKTVQVFSLEELQAILAGFKDHAPAYYPFALFLASTGCRLSEAIGLRWLRVDLQARTVTLADSLSIDRTGNGYRRVMKETKTGSVRTLALSDSLTTVLASLRAEGTEAESLVFRSPQGLVISAQNFRRVWGQVLEAQAVAYRKIHCLRHTALSHALDQGQPVPAVAYMAGHKDGLMVMTTYGHRIGQVCLPDLGL